MHLMILGEGATSRYQSREQAKPKVTERLCRAAERSAEILGIHSVRSEFLPDNRFDEVPLLDIVKRIEKVLHELLPVHIYTHHPGDLNMDHRLTFQAVLTAARPLKECPVLEIYTFEIPSSTEWAFQQLQPAFKPSVFVDISQTLETKMNAMAQYESECQEFPHPRSPEALRCIARRWGSVVGLMYAEVFELVRSVRR